MLQKQLPFRFVNRYLVKLLLIISVSLLHSDSINDNSQDCTAVKDSDRVDCGHNQITESECVKHPPCRWCPSTGGQNVPWCFVEKKDINYDCLAFSNIYKIDCLHDTRAFMGECISRGCFWCPSHINGVPWCFNYSVVFSTNQYVGVRASTSFTSDMLTNIYKSTSFPDVENTLIDVHSHSTFTYLSHSSIYPSPTSVIISLSNLGQSFDNNNTLLRSKDINNSFKQSQSQISTDLNYQINLYKTSIDMYSSSRVKSASATFGGLSNSYPTQSFSLSNNKKSTSVLKTINSSINKNRLSVTTVKSKPDTRSCYPLRIVVSVTIVATLVFSVLVAGLVYYCLLKRGKLTLPRYDGYAQYSNASYTID